MAGYKVSPGNIFGRIGSGIGQGLAESLPKEIERGRLAEGLGRFEQEAANLTPMQQYSRIAAIPGMTPESQRQFGELARQQARGQALIESSKANQPQVGPSFSPRQGNIEGQPSNIPSITRSKPLEEIQRGYIPPTKEEKEDFAAHVFEENRQRFGNDPDKARQYSEEHFDQLEKRNKAFETLHGNLTKVQDNVVDRLKNHSTKLGVKIPENVYTQVEDEAVQATKSKEEGGRGLTEQQAIKEYGEKMDAISREYGKIDAIGNWGVTGRNAGKTLSSFESIQKDFAKRGDLRNLADRMVAVNGLSPMMAYAISEKVSQVPQLNSAIKSLPSLSIPGRPLIPKHEIQKKTREIVPKLEKLLGEKGSPLAVAYELEKKGYDPDVWMAYLAKNKDKLSLSGDQRNQIDTPINTFGTWNDWWLQSWTGLGE